MSKKAVIKEKNKIEAVLILPDIRSAHNVGSIFRTSDAVGISRIFLCGYTPRPLDKFDRPQKEIAKTALGGEKTIPWVYEKSVVKVIESLKSEGFKITAIEQTDNSIDYKKFKCSKKVAFILGNEVDGMSKKVLDKCDAAIEIPMRGEKESLNVAVAAGIVLFRVLNV